MRRPHPPPLKGHPGHEAIQALRGVGPVLGAVFIAEIGDVTRFDNPRRLCSWAGLTSRSREFDTHTHRGHITKQRSRLLRWAAVEAVFGAVRDPRSHGFKTHANRAMMKLGVRDRAPLVVLAYENGFVRPRSEA